MAVAAIIGTLLYFYGVLIVVYVLMSWFPISGVLAEIHNVLGSIVEPYLSLFRRFIPPVGAVDISPMVAILVLMAIRALL
jgi:YggT family protein